jgi:glycosyltransferase involved in cell wall biosynthesis
MTNKKLLFIWNYHYFPFEKGKSRFSDLLDAFVKEGYQVEVITSSFYHMGKMQRDIEDPKYQSLGYKVTFVREPGYKKNVSFARIRSMNHFNAGVKKILKTHESVDVVYIPVPSIKLAAIGEKWCKKVGAKSVIDVEDLWPESFQMIVKPKVLYQLATWPLMLEANRAYQQSDAVVAVSQTYLDRVSRIRRGHFPCAVAPIGADIEYIDNIVKKNPLRKPEGEFWISYIGTFGKSYDLHMVIDSVSSLYSQGNTHLILKLMGSGPDFSEVEAYARSRPGNFEFLGLLPYEQMCQILTVSDVGVNPIVKGSVASLINKVADYAACGLPVINSQDCDEYRTLIADYGAGINVPAGDAAAFKEALADLCHHPDFLGLLRTGALRLAKEKLSRRQSERSIIGIINKI